MEYIYSLKNPLEQAVTMEEEKPDNNLDETKNLEYFLDLSSSIPISEFFHDTVSIENRKLRKPWNAFYIDSKRVKKSHRARQLVKSPTHVVRIPVKRVKSFNKKNSGEDLPKDSVEKVPRQIVETKKSNRKKKAKKGRKNKEEPQRKKEIQKSNITKEIVEVDLREESNSKRKTKKKKRPKKRKRKDDNIAEKNEFEPATKKMKLLIKENVLKTQGKYNKLHPKVVKKKQKEKERKKRKSQREWAQRIDQLNKRRETAIEIKKNNRRLKNVRGKKQYKDKIIRKSQINRVGFEGGVRKNTVNDLAKVSNVVKKRSKGKLNKMRKRKRK